MLVLDETLPQGCDGDVRPAQVVNCRKLRKYLEIQYDHLRVLKLFEGRKDSVADFLDPKCGVD